jgi:hypothetical protein
MLYWLSHINYMQPTLHSFSGLALQQSHASGEGCSFILSLIHL